MIVKDKRLIYDYDQLMSVVDDCLVNAFKGYVCAVNANILINCYKYSDYNKIIDCSIANICDGVNVRRINNLLGLKKVQNYPAPDFFLRVMNEQRYKKYFIGGSPEISSSLFNRLSIKYPGIEKKDFYSPPFLNVNDFDYKSIGCFINKSSPDIIWVGLGAPKQEIFMHKLLPYINRGVMIGVGAVFNFYSGIKSLKRAPYIFRKYNLEWLYRALQEPKRIIPRQIRSAYYLPRIFISDYLDKYR